MPQWVATSFGALDLRGRPEGSEGAEYSVVPTVPGEPLILSDEAAALWRRLAETPGGVDGAVMSDADRTLLLEFTASGIAAPDLSHPSRTGAPPEPWLSSMFHELVYALVANVCRALGVRAVFIKGPVLHSQGLRDREHSGDVDVWIEPGAELRVAEAMKPWGWDPVLSPFAGTGVPHSLTLRAPAWACAIDVHTRFPGIGLPDVEALTMVLEGAGETRFAGVAATVPDRAVGGVLFALHEARPLPGHGEPRTDAAARVLRRVGVDALAVADRLHAAPALAPALRLAFADDQVSALATIDEPVPESWARLSEPSSSRRNLRALRDVRWRDRPRVLWWLVWPPAENVLEADRLAGGSGKSVWGARVRRASRSLRSLTRPLR